MNHDWSSADILCLLHHFDELNDICRIGRALLLRPAWELVMPHDPLFVRSGVGQGELSSGVRDIRKVLCHLDKNSAVLHYAV